MTRGGRITRRAVSSRRAHLIVLLTLLPAAAVPADEATSLFPAPEGRFFLAGQANAIFQWHDSFPALYSGPHSLRAEAENATSFVVTLYTGLEVTRGVELLVHVESAGGRGISDALGLAGFTNLDVVRNPALGATPYLARLMLHAVVPLSEERADASRGPLSLATTLPARRLELRIGKLGLADVLDLNTVGSDSHLQFANWTVDNNGGYDYAADTRGYTVAAVVEYQDRAWAARFAEALMPKVANGIELDFDLGGSHSENLELELRHRAPAGRTGVLRLLGYANHANMGSYSEAIDAFLAGRDPVPDIEAHREEGRLKYGFGLNLEEPLTDRLTAFGRGGWNEGKNESFAYTEVNQSLALGADWKGGLRRGSRDKAGLALVVNGLSADHRRYLELGGLGFLLGDGTLRYGRETIVEAYYTFAFGHGIFGSAGLQHIAHPGYNQDRGPVTVPMLRLHLEL